MNLLTLLRAVAAGGVLFLLYLAYGVVTLLVLAREEVKSARLSELEGRTDG